MSPAFELTLMVAPLVAGTVASTSPAASIDRLPRTAPRPLTQTVPFSDVTDTSRGVSLDPGGTTTFSLLHPPSLTPRAFLQRMTSVPSSSSIVSVPTGSDGGV